MIIHRYLGMYPVANGEADVRDEYENWILITDALYLEIISSIF